MRKINAQGGKIEVEKVRRCVKDGRWEVMEVGIGSAECGMKKNGRCEDGKDRS